MAVGKAGCHTLEQAGTFAESLCLLDEGQGGQVEAVPVEAHAVHENEVALYFRPEAGQAQLAQAGVGKGAQGIVAPGVEVVGCGPSVGDGDFTRRRGAQEVERFVRRVVLVEVGRAAVLHVGAGPVRVVKVDKLLCDQRLEGSAHLADLGGRGVVQRQAAAHGPAAARATLPSESAALGEIVACVADGVGGRALLTAQLVVNGFEGIRVIRGLCREAECEAKGREQGGDSVSHRQCDLNGCAPAPPSSVGNEGKGVVSGKVNIFRRKRPVCYPLFLPAWRGCCGNFVW